MSALPLPRLRRPAPAWLPMLLAAALAVPALLGPTAPASAAPEDALRAPREGAMIVGDQVTVVLDSDAPRHLLWLDLWPVVSVDGEGSYTFAGVPAGEHQLRVEAVRGDSASFDPPVFQVVRFSTAGSAGAAGAGGGMMMNAALMPVAGGGLPIGADWAGALLAATGAGTMAAGHLLRRARPGRRPGA